MHDVEEDARDQEAEQQDDSDEHLNGSLQPAHPPNRLGATFFFFSDGSDGDDVDFF